MAPSDSLVNYLGVLILTIRMQKQNMSKLQCPWLSSIPRYLAVFYYRASKKNRKPKKMTEISMSVCPILSTDLEWNKKKPLTLI